MRRRKLFDGLGAPTPGPAGSPRLIGWPRPSAIVGPVAVACLALGCTALVGLALPWSAAAAAPSAAGWWWRPQALPIGLAPPPNVPEGGLLVAEAPDGAAAVAAVRLTLPAGEEARALVLDVADGTTAGGIGIVACPAKTAWKPAAGGPWAERPLPDCDVARAAGAPAPDGRSFRFELGGFTRDGEVDLVLGVAAPRDGSAMTARQVVFAKPASGAFTTATAAGGGEAPPPEVPAADPPAPEASDPGPPPPAPPTGAPGAAGPDGSFDTSEGGLDAAAPGEAAPLDEAAGAAGAGGPIAAGRPLAGPLPLATQPASTTSSSGRGGVVGLALVLGGVAAAVKVSGTRPRARQPVGRFGGGPDPLPPTEPTVGGLGRFVAERTTRPPSLT